MRTPRRIIFRCMAVLLGLSVFAALEGICRLAGWGDELPAADPFAEFTSVRPLFTLSPGGRQFEVAENRRLYFAAESFPAIKTSRQRRVFVFGGSTVQGRPFSIPTAFTTFMEIGLKQADPSADWKVINCGGVSYASYRLLPVMQECLQYQPDLYVVCTGHNEFLECITYADVRTSSPLVRTSHGVLSNLHSFRLLQQTVRRDTVRDGQTRTAALPEEVDAILDHQGGLAAYTRAALQSDQITQQFARNLNEMIDLAQSAAVPLLLLLPPSNLRDCPPFKSEFDLQTTAEERKTIAETLSAAAAIVSDDPNRAIGLLREAVATDKRFAFSWYELGKVFLNRNQPVEAEGALIRARDEDVCPLRMTSSLEQVMRRVAEQNDVPLLNLHELMADHSRDRIVGAAVLVDHIHPSFRSHQLIALEVIKWMAASDNISVREDSWTAPAQAAFDQHLQSLDDLYFLRGRRTLRTLNAWTQGRGDGPPLEGLKPDGVQGAGVD